MISFVASVECATYDHIISSSLIKACEDIPSTQEVPPNSIKGKVYAVLLTSLNCSRIDFYYFLSMFTWA
jgi:hypothetical protein